MRNSEHLVRILAKLAAQSGGIESAVRDLEMLGASRQEVRAAVEQYEREVERIRSLRVVGGLDNPELPTPWYPGPQPDHVFWPALKRALLEQQGLDGAAIGMIDRASTAVVSRLAPPGQPDGFQMRGLVVGYVQSGKTTNFTAVIAKAADVGYRLFIVLSGLTNNLRLQTQGRIEETLIGAREQDWYNLTPEGDFTGPGNAANLLGNRSHRLVAAVKKNPSRLERLNQWLDSAPVEILQSLPILVIDDEADQASIDVGSEEERSRINHLIVKLLDRPRAAYVGYTATPFANLLADPSYPDNLYPRHFILDLPRPKGYFGTDSIFGREPLTHEEQGAATDGYDVIRYVAESELTYLRPPWNKEKRAEWTPAVTPSLEEAIRYFVLATAARRVRGSGNLHSTMLIHTSQLTDAQLGLQGPVQDLMQGMSAQLHAGDPALLSELEVQWEEEQQRIPPETFDEAPVLFSQLLERIPEVLTDIDVVVDNYRSQERLDYRNGRKTVIAIGGNTLSRGLTLEGLVVSFFVRSTSYYDTLLQMGRWFGYREGYADLPRVWMTSDLQDWFIHLATVEQEVRYEIQRYEKESLNPLDVPVRIRTHPKLNVTSAAKMRSAVQAGMSFSARRVQTILFNHRDAEWLRSNLNAARALVQNATRAGHPPQPLGHGNWLLTGVPADEVLEFLRMYSFHEGSHDLKTNLLTGYIGEQNSLGELREWNVVIMGSARGDSVKTTDLELGRPVGLITRSRIQNPGQSYANIKALMSREDMVADLGLDVNSLDDLSFDRLIRMRPPGLGLLLVYPIDRNSQPGATAGGKQRRVGLDAVEDVIGVGMVFPKARSTTPQNYVSADLPEIEREEQEVIEADDLDTEPTDSTDAVA